MSRFRFNEDKAINACLYILSKIGTSVDLHKIFKILYFADQRHLAQFGRPISGDWYRAMQFGPVPSIIYDILKAVRDAYGYNIDPGKFNKYFSVEMVDNIDFVEAISKPDLEILSETEIECLDVSINQNKDLSFAQLVEKSHDFAWQQNKGNEISVLDIAYAGGADKEMLKYIELLSENENLTLS